MTTQKTWYELLGYQRGNERVEGTYIVRVLLENRRRILHSFDTNQQATECFNQWRNECSVINQLTGV